MSTKQKVTTIGRVTTKTRYLQTTHCSFFGWGWAGGGLVVGWFGLIWVWYNFIVVDLVGLLFCLLLLVVLLLLLLLLVVVMCVCVCV